MRRLCECSAIAAPLACDLSLMVRRKPDVNRHRQLHRFAVKCAPLITPLQDGIFRSLSQGRIAGKKEQAQKWASW